jgi:anti-sigma B factor antagonist
VTESGFEAPAFSVEADRRGPAAVVTVSGELDISTAPEFQAALDRLEPGFEQLVVDLSSCSFFASSGISILLDEKERAARAGFELVIVKAPPPVQRMFDLVGLHEKLTFQEPSD